MFERRVVRNPVREFLPVDRVRRKQAQWKWQIALLALSFLFVCWHTNKCQKYKSVEFAASKLSESGTVGPSLYLFHVKKYHVKYQKLIWHISFDKTELEIWIWTGKAQSQQKPHKEKDTLDHNFD